MASPSFAYTISCFAKVLGEPEGWLDELAIVNPGPDGRCSGILNDMDFPTEQPVSVTAFTEDGIEVLKELVVEVKRQ
ncbi:hypothetical protein KEX41_28345 (plasmid) [Burkholderia thailandensis]|uniref:hypothetical protein n=1 Tax=Burkholderia thailandensis TaxID=57975 RepID=UPI00192DD0FF|nr:hypothetical protein [Burkholderia thailandensis]MBS2132100.1 hypothetical protein [Burkholderia thailandensis]QRA15211.1 hypothetical protein JMY07_30380 [Burkholderia thailandensis]